MSKLEQPLDLFSNSAVWYSELSENESIKNDEALKLVLREGAFDAVFYADSKGLLYSSNTAFLDISSYDSFKQAMQGKRNISDVTPYSVLYHQPMISLPVILDSINNHKGSLRFYNPQKFAEISSSDTENKNVITVLMDQKGNLLTSSDKSNIFFSSKFMGK